eukprot:Skav225911  [mRNA]  locus=scaffold1500:95238:105346:- [translate_table: standard]
MVHAPLHSSQAGHWLRCGGCDQRRFHSGDVQGCIFRQSDYDEAQPADGLYALIHDLDQDGDLTMDELIRPSANGVLALTESVDKLKRSVDRKARPESEQELGRWRLWLCFWWATVGFADEAELNDTGPTGGEGRVARLPDRTAAITMAVSVFQVVSAEQQWPWAKVDSRLGAGVLSWKFFNKEDPVPLILPLGDGRWVVGHGGLEVDDLAIVLRAIEDTYLGRAVFKEGKARDSTSPVAEPKAVMKKPWGCHGKRVQAMEDGIDVLLEDLDINCEVKAGDFSGVQNGY